MPACALRSCERPPMRTQRSDVPDLDVTDVHGGKGTNSAGDYTSVRPGDAFTIAAGSTLSNSKRRVRRRTGSAIWRWSMLSRTLRALSGGRSKVSRSPSACPVRNSAIRPGVRGSPSRSARTLTGMRERLWRLAAWRLPVVGGGGSDLRLGGASVRARHVPLSGHRGEAGVRPVGDELFGRRVVGRLGCVGHVDVLLWSAVDFSTGEVRAPSRRSRLPRAPAGHGLDGRRRGLGWEGSTADAGVSWRDHAGRKVAAASKNPLSLFGWERICNVACRSVDGGTSSRGDRMNRNLPDVSQWRAPRRAFATP